jgi:hypothetical protein
MAVRETGPVPRSAAMRTGTSDPGTSHRRGRRRLIVILALVVSAWLLAGTWGVMVPYHIPTPDSTVLRIAITVVVVMLLAVVVRWQGSGRVSDDIPDRVRRARSRSGGSVERSASEPTAWDRYRSLATPSERSSSVYRAPRGGAPRRGALGDTPPSGGSPQSR